MLDAALFSVAFSQLCIIYNLRNNIRNEKSKPTSGKNNNLS